MALVLEDFDQAPPLEAAEWACFHNAHTIADLGFVFLIVGVKFGDVFGNLAELGVRHTGDSAHNNGFIHFVGDDLADSRLAESTLTCRGGSRDGGGFFAHLLCGWRRRFPAEHGFDTGDIAAQCMKHMRFF